MPEIKPEIETIAKIRVVGVGGSGGSAINRMVTAKIRGVDFIAVNTDLQALHHNLADRKHKLPIGQKLTRGLGAGMNPEVGLSAAQENAAEIRELLRGSDMVFITCGLGGGTGTGASPVVAQIAKELGALVVAVVTKPFTFEGKKRQQIAEDGLEVLSQNVDAIITIPNDKVSQIIDQKTSMVDAFKAIDDILRQGIQGISEIITVPALINVDFADVKAIMKEAGSALMSIGESSGETRSQMAARMAISSPLLDLSIEGAKGILFVITGGPSLTMSEVGEIADVITKGADENAKIIFGANIDEGMKDKIRVTLLATGFGDGIRSDSNRNNPLKNKLNSIFVDKSPKNADEEIKITKNSFSRSNQETVVKVKSLTDDAGMEKRSFWGAKSLIKDKINTETEADQSNMEEMDSEEPEIMPISSPTRVNRVLDEGEDEDLEIPTFLRKKMK
ncbi:MAG: cell division protein FtsZ [Patescibacteria group bacterium]|jgi:cell division protein FtsZ